MSNISSPSSDPSRHRRYKPGKTGASLAESRSGQTESDTESRSGLIGADWRPAVSALEQNYGARLAELEERLAAAEREVVNLSGQIKEMR